MLLVSLLGALAAVAPQASGFVASKYTIVHSREGVIPAGWTRSAAGPVDKRTVRLELRIYLSQPRVSDFYELATKIATPGDALYGQHLSKKDADALLAPGAESLKLVREWLESERLGRRARVGSAGDSLVVVVSVEEAERLLRTEYDAFVDQRSGRTVMRTLQYSVPDGLAGLIDVIEPTTFFGMKRMRMRLAEDGTRADGVGAEAQRGSTVPARLSELYNYRGAEAYSNGRMGIGGFLGQFASASDLSVFMRRYGTQNNADEGFACVSVHGGGCAPDPTGIEANLDTQYARAVTQRIPNVYYSTAGSGPALGNVTDNEPYLELLDHLVALPDGDLPNTLSISYGDGQESVPDNYAAKCCDLFARLGARGVSVLVASGDGGVGATCAGRRFETLFPASCPWVTAVGGTDTDGPGREEAWRGSGGGFSDRFPRPAYQARAVGAWLESDRTHRAQTPYFNASGRAIPDVAALAVRYAVVVDNTTVGVSGTSASTPVFAALVQLLNSDRLLRGKKPLGFLNPWLYGRAASAMTDITRGSSAGCKNINGKGFHAVP
ncbi:hypothetical protein E4U53_004141, partial [Claviceps sorghi]